MWNGGSVGDGVDAWKKRDLTTMTGSCGGGV